jgi:hypothetical protein
MAKEDLKPEDLREFEAGQGIDLTEFEGIKTKIAGMEILDVDSRYDEDGNLFDGNLTRKVKVLRVYTEVITTVKNKEGEDADIRASELFNLKFQEGEWGISKSPKSKIQKFLLRQKVDKITKLKGTSVLTKSVTNKTGNVFLGFVIA